MADRGLEDVGVLVGALGDEAAAAAGAAIDHESDPAAPAPRTGVSRATGSAAMRGRPIPRGER